MGEKFGRYATWPAVNAADRKRMDDEDRAALQAERDSDAAEIADTKLIDELERKEGLTGPAYLAELDAARDLPEGSDE